MRTITEEEAVGVDELSVKMVTANGLVGIKWQVKAGDVCFTIGATPPEW